MFDQMLTYNILKLSPEHFPGYTEYEVGRWYLRIRI